MDRQSDFPYHFDATACRSCRGRCCRGRAGYVWIDRKELEEMAGAGKMTAARFAARYVRLVAGRLSLQERLINGEHICCFFDPAARRCTIYENRPGQCRTFPFWERFRKEVRELIDECPGVSLKTQFLTCLMVLVAVIK